MHYILFHVAVIDTWLCCLSFIKSQILSIYFIVFDLQNSSHHKCVPLFWMGNSVWIKCILKEGVLKKIKSCLKTLNYSHTAIQRAQTTVFLPAEPLNTL